MKSLPGLLIGLAAGTILGILMAPSSGKDTRQRISDDTDKFFKDLQDQLQTGLDNIKNQYNDLVGSGTSRAQNGASRTEAGANS